MADVTSIRLSAGEEPYMQPDRLQLRSYLPHEIDQISLVQITQTQTFDNLMKGTCVKCHRFTCKTNGLNGKILMAQLSAIDMGMFEVVDELESFVGGKLKEKGDNSDKGDVSSLCENDAVLKCIDSALNRITERAKTNSDEHSVKPVKNGVELRQSLLRAYLRNHLFKHVRRCQLCGRNNGTIKNDVGRCILIHFGVGTKSARCIPLVLSKS
ncbi:unnamed protein product [Anisakis simplex]|uniref:Uncharacterized protein n=1 Tax=Anisakis simplex TaxID=6269 RepID=A0A0M3KGR9_ANISI|nr:unnamed protein product [Anisakis simplex]